MDPGDILNQQLKNAGRKEENDAARDFQRQSARAGDPISLREARDRQNAQKEGNRDMDARIRTIANEAALAAVEQISLTGPGVEGQGGQWSIDPKKQEADAGAARKDDDNTIRLTYIDETGAERIGTFVLISSEAAP